MGGGGGLRQGMGGDLIVFVSPARGSAFDQSCSPGEGMFESFFARRGTAVGRDLTAESNERD